jgi:hypothetical protein
VRLDDARWRAGAARRPLEGGEPVDRERRSICGGTGDSAAARSSSTLALTTSNARRARKRASVVRASRLSPSNHQSRETNMKTTFRSTSRPSRSCRRVAAAAFVLVGGLVAGGATAFADQPVMEKPVIPAGANFTAWTDNGEDGKIVLQLLKGDMPMAGAVVAGTVKSDANCAADAQGLSHCHNAIALADGGAIEAIHIHAMGRHPCLFPGQRVSISRLDGDWLVATAPQ